MGGFQRGGVTAMAIALALSGGAAVHLSEPTPLRAQDLSNNILQFSELYIAVQARAHMGSAQKRGARVHTFL